jgi:hypothetical protein
MKNILIIIGMIVVVAAGYFVVKTTKNPVVSKNTATYSSRELGLQFTYETGPEGYVLGEMTPADTSAHLLKTITLTQTKDVQAGVPQGGEGPATITIYVFDNVKKQQPSVWLLEHKNYSGVAKTQPAEYVVGGANAVRFDADGLYASDNVVVAHGNMIYMFIGNYMDAQSKLKKDFQPLLDSVQFIPTVEQGTSVKINIDAVCEGALAYMTFPDGKSADAFVAECKEGKHPEVIEKFKKDMGVGDGKAI